MLIDPFMPYVIKRRRLKPRATATPPQPPGEPPVLVIANFDADAMTLTLGFDRAVDTGGLVATDLRVADAVVTGWSYVAMSGVDRPDAVTVVLRMETVEPVQGEAIELTAEPGNGIRAVDGAAWDGVSGLYLPFEQTATPKPAAKSARAKKVSRKKRAA